MVCAQGPFADFNGAKIVGLRTIKLFLHLRDKSQSEKGLDEVRVRVSQKFFTDGEPSLPKRLGLLKRLLRKNITRPDC